MLSSIYSLFSDDLETEVQTIKTADALRNKSPGKFHGRGWDPEPSGKGKAQTTPLFSRPKEGVA